MGRYDKIKVYSNSSFRTPNRVQIYHNNTWVDLGTNNDKTNQKDLKVYHNNEFKIATKKWTKTGSHLADKYSTGSFSLSPGNGFCYRTTQNTWRFQCDYVRKTTSGSQNVFTTGSSSNYVKVIWEDDNRIHVYVKSSYYGSEQHIYSGNTFGANTWISLNVYQDKSASKMYIYVNGNQEAASGNWGSNYNWNISNASNTVSDSYVNMKGNLYVQGVQYNAGAHNESGDVSNYATMHEEWVDDYDWV